MGKRNPGLEQAILEHGEEVFCHDYGNSHFGDVVSVLQFKGEYWSHAGECGTFGPFSNLKEALLCEDAGVLEVTTASTSISCSELSAEEIVEMLKPGSGTWKGVLADWKEGRDEEDDSEKFYLSINGEEWFCTESGWHPVKQKRRRRRKSS
jgi:hypothetical protein